MIFNVFIVKTSILHASAYDNRTLPAQGDIVGIRLK